MSQCRRADMQMRICLFLPSFLPEIGGLEIAADRLALQLKSLGQEVVVLAQRPRRALGPIERPYPIIYYSRPRSRWYPCSSWFPLSVGSALERAHREFGFHIVHAYHAYLPGYVAVRWARRHNIPVVVSCRGSDMYPHARPRQWWLSRRRIIWALKHAQAVTSVSRQLAEEVSIITNNSVRTQVIHNGVEIPEPDSSPKLTPPAFACLENQTFLLVLGRLHRDKGLDLLINALKLLRDQGKTLPLVVLAGDGREKERILQQINAHKLEDRVLCIGQVWDSKKAWLLSNCSFFVKPSRAEGLPNSVLEAMSYGKAVLATAVGGLPELLTSGEDGLLVEPDNPTALASGLQKMLNTDLSSYEQNARRVAQEHSMEKIAKLYLGLYQSVIER
ncbi:MAG: glycosyltransferase family 4 protein [Phycisphaerae bacterium]|nr:glycosyltransferase family 4 protein [Phycisphaerae bacterium]